MSDRGKYHGQRLKTKDVLRLYTAGERDFRGAILRGCNFREADLSGADFTKTDICGTKFVNATLDRVRFCNAKAGIQKRWWVGKSLLIGLIVIVSGALQAVTGGLIGISLANASTLLYGLVGAVTVFAVIFSIFRLGFTLETLVSITLSVMCITIAANTYFFFAGRLLIGLSGTDESSSMPTTTALVLIISLTTIALTLSFVGTLMSTFVGIFASSEVTAFSIILYTVSAFTVGFIIAGTTGMGIDFSGTYISSFSGVILIAVSNCWLYTHIQSCMRKNNLKFENLRKISVAAAALGGTSFSGSNLNDSLFTYVRFRSPNFVDSHQNPTILNRVSWHGAEGLDRARLGTSNLQDPRVRNLLVTLNGVDQDLTNADLCGVNLAGAKLHRINLKGAILYGATLEGAELHGVNLTEAQCIGTDFTGAQLTGACLEAWNIDETTILKDIDCEYVFLKAQPDRYGNRERRPHNPDKIFQPGDFEKFFKEMLDTVQILIRQGIHPQVFKETLAQLMADYDLPDDAVQGFEKKGEDMLVTIAVPPDTDKGQFEQDFDKLQALKLEAAKTQGLLEGERKRADDLKAIMLSLGPAAANVTVTNTAMTNSNNPNISAADGSFVNTGDNLQGNVISLRELSGQVTVQINQLPDAAPSADQRSLKDLLTELQAAIEADTELNDIEKKEALGEVGKLAEAGTQPQENAMQRVAKRAAANLKAITEPLTEASNLVTVCKSLLPLILALFV